MLRSYIGAVRSVGVNGVGHQVPVGCSVWKVCWCAGVLVNVYSGSGLELCDCAWFKRLVECSSIPQQAGPFGTYSS